MASALAPSYQHRKAWIERLTSQALRSSARDDLVLRLLYAPEAAADVRKMVEQERICCAFLTFDLDERGDAVFVTITAQEAAQILDMLFGQFLAGRRDPPPPSPCGSIVSHETTDEASAGSFGSSQCVRTKFVNAS